MSETEDEMPRALGWRFKQEISTGDILLALSLCISVGLPLLYWASGIDKRLAAVEERARVQTRIDDRQEQMARDNMQLIMNELRDIKSYLLNHPLPQERQ